MRVVTTLVFHGPNVWSQAPVLEVWLEPVAGDNLTRDHWRAAAARLARWLTALPAPVCDEFAAAASPAELLWRLTLAMQQIAGEPVRHGWSEEHVTSDTARFAVEFTEETVARRCLDVALRLCDAARWDEPFPLAAAVQELRDHAGEVRMGGTTRPLVAAARARGIPAIRLDQESLVQLGHGSRQRRIRTAVTDGTGFIAEAISRDKFLTKQLLRRLGIPVPAGRIVVDAADAWAAACELGTPVVVKPRDSDFGNGISLRLRTRDEISTADHRAREFSSSVLVETMLPGAHHRVLVVGERVVGAIRREASHVIGDGVRNVAALIAVVNRDPRRADDDPTSPWFRIAIDDETERALTRQNLRLESVPAAGQNVLTRWTTSHWNGDMLIDVTDDLHPHVVETVLDAVRTVGLDIAGVDLIATDVRRPLEEQHGGILEVNAEPAILIHMHPVCQPSRSVPEAIMTHLFPQPAAARIPIVAVCGDDDATPLAARLHRALARAGQRVGSVRGDGVFIGERRLSLETPDRAAATRTLLLHPRVDAAVCQLSADELRRDGLPFDRCDAALLLNLRSGANVISPQAPSNFSPDDLRRAARVLMESVGTNGAAVVNADDPECARLVASSAERVVLISTNAQQPLVAQSRSRGGRVVFPRGDSIVLAEGPRELTLHARRSTTTANITTDIAITMLAAVATAWAMNLDPEQMYQSFEAVASESSANAAPTMLAPPEPRRPPLVRVGQESAA